jgi:hypothetical protein
LLPLAAFLFFGAKHQPAESGGKVAVGKVLGRAAGFATAGCAENAHAGLRVGEPKALPFPQSRNTVCGWNSGRKTGTFRHRCERLSLRQQNEM